MKKLQKIQTTLIAKLEERTNLECPEKYIITWMKILFQITKLKYKAVAFSFKKVSFCGIQIKWLTNYAFLKRKKGTTADYLPLQHMNKAPKNEKAASERVGMTNSDLEE